MNESIKLTEEEKCLADAGAKLARDLSEVRLPCALSPGSPPLHRQFELGDLAKTIWRAQWRWALSQLWNSQKLDSSVFDFVDWALAESDVPEASSKALTAAKYGVGQYLYA